MISFFFIIILILFLPLHLLIFLPLLLLLFPLLLFLPLLLLLFFFLFFFFFFFLLFIQEDLNLILVQILLGGGFAPHTPIRNIYLFMPALMWLRRCSVSLPWMRWLRKSTAQIVRKPQCLRPHTIGECHHDFDLRVSDGV